MTRERGHSFIHGRGSQTEGVKFAAPEAESLDSSEFVPGKLCTLGFRAETRNVGIKIQANCPGGQVGEIKESIETRGKNPCGRRRVGREASVKPQISVREIQKGFLSSDK